MEAKIVKYIHFVIGIIIFSLFITLIFTVASLIGTDYESRDAAAYSALAGDYDDYIIEGSKANSTIRNVEDKLTGKKTVVSIGSDILKAAVDGVVLFFGSITTLTTLTDQIIEESGGRIHPLFGTAILSIITIVFVVMVISMLMRFKPEA